MRLESNIVRGKQSRFAYNSSSVSHVKSKVVDVKSEMIKRE